MTQRSVRAREARRVLGVALVVTAQGWAATAAALNLRGRVQGQEHLRNPVWMEARDAANHGYSFREPVPTVASEFRRLSPQVSRELCVVALGSGRTRRTAAKVEVLWAGGGANPATVVVAPGTELTLSNRDPFVRRPFAVGLSTFGAAAVQTGSTRKWTARDSGLVEFRDETSPSVRLWVVARDGVIATGAPNDDGTFILDLPEPGNYTLQVYFAGKAIGDARSVTMGRGPLDLTRLPLVVATAPSVTGGDPAASEGAP
jgi:hypothetical protein